MKTRRDFLKKTALFGAYAFMPPSLLGQESDGHCSFSRETTSSLSLIHIFVECVAEDVIHSAAPSGMNSGYHGILPVVEQDGNAAVSYTHLYWGTVDNHCVLLHDFRCQFLISEVFILFLGA